MALRADGVGLGEPVRDLVVDLLDALDPEGVQVVAGEKDSIRRKRGSSRRRASTTWPSTHARRGWSAAKLIRTWSAIRVFSGRTVTGPLRSASAIDAVDDLADVRRLAGEVVLELRSRRRCGSDCGWRTGARSGGHVHMSYSSTTILPSLPPALKRS